MYFTNKKPELKVNLTGSAHLGFASNAGKVEMVLYKADGSDDWLYLNTYEVEDANNIEILLNGTDAVIEFVNYELKDNLGNTRLYPNPNHERETIELPAPKLPLPDTKPHWKAI